MGACRANNPRCALASGESLLQGDSMRVQPCDICCSEPNFCPECRCLLCCNEISFDAQGIHNWVQCTQGIGGGFALCGHSVHLECAVLNRMAGVVSGVLDVEYLCRRCDKKTDLSSQANRLVKTACLAPSGIVAEKHLELCFKIVQGTKREALKSLEQLVRSAISQAAGGGDVQDILKELCERRSADHKPKMEEDERQRFSRDMVLATYMEEHRHREGGPPPFETLVSQYQDQVDAAMAQLRESQEQEVEAARRALTNQMNRVLDGYRRVHQGVEDFKRSKSQPSDVNTVHEFIGQCERLIAQLKDDRPHFDKMLKIGNGFGSISREFLREAFDWPPQPPQAE